MIYERTKTLYKLESKWSMLLRLLAIVILYPTVFPFAPLIAFALITLGGVFAELSEILTVFGLVLAIAIIIFTVFAIKYTVALRRRRKLVRGLKKLGTLPGYTGQCFSPHTAASLPLNMTGSILTCSSSLLSTEAHLSYSHRQPMHISATA